MFFGPKQHKDLVTPFISNSTVPSLQTKTQPTPQMSRDIALLTVFYFKRFPLIGASSCAVFILST
jgi:hypothetical protein